MEKSPKKLDSLDRQILETLILPWYAAHPGIRRVLFVGCADFTQFYESFFADQDYFTIEINPARAQYGATKPKHHFIDSVENVDRYFLPSSLDLIIINGVFGWGLDQQGLAETVIDKFYDLLSTQGALMIGWNKLAKNTPFIPSELSGLNHFDRVTLPGMEAFEFAQRLSNGDYLINNKWQHVFSFYTKKKLMNPINEKTLSFTTTAMPRPEIAQATYDSFTRNLLGLDFSKVTLYINIDSFPNQRDDFKRQEVVEVARRYFGNVVVNMPDKPSFAAAVKWCFSMIETPYNFHLEDDWELLFPFHLSSFNQFFIPPHIQQVALRSRGNVRQDFFLCPSFIRGSFCREMSEKMKIADNPEVEIRDIKNREEIYAKESFVMYPFDTQSLIVQDLGRTWIKSSGYERGGTHFVQWGVQ